MFNNYTVGKVKKPKGQKEAHDKLVKSLLDFIVLQFLSTEPMHGYQIISRVRQNFGIYLRASTIYPLLGALEENGCVTSEWNINSERPKKVYRLTREGRQQLLCAENSLNSICRKLAIQAFIETSVTLEPADGTRR
ncbi:MAG: PadR family transcriptional regulator [Candidatus Bathyarchaeia archaeon]